MIINNTVNFTKIIIIIIITYSTLLSEIANSFFVGPPSPEELKQMVEQAESNTGSDWSFDWELDSLEWSVSTPSSSSGVSPQIEVHKKGCLVGVCDTESYVLKWNGQCVNFPSITDPLTSRVCARITLPNKNGNKSDKTRLCAFLDPGFPYDLNDWDDYLMPFHHNTSSPEVGKQDITDVLMQSNSKEEELPPDPSAIGAIVDFVSEAVDKLDETINHEVTKNLGCIDLPMKPAPPPFCPILSTIKPTPQLINICKRTFLPQEEIQVPTITNPCEIGESIEQKYNNFDNIGIRIAFDNFLKLCSNDEQIYYENYINTGEDPKNKFHTLSIPSCVIFRNIETDNQNSIKKFKDDYNNLISECDGSSSEPCVDFPVPQKQKGIKYRVGYYIYDSQNKIISSANPFNNKQEYNIFPWVNTPNSLVIAGINYGNFVDINASYEKNKKNLLGNDYSILDNGGNPRKFHIESNETKKFCVYDENKREVGCATKALPPKPIVAKCNQQICKQFGNKTNCLKQSCEENFDKPIIAVGLGVDNFQQTYIQYTSVNYIDRILALFGYKNTSDKKTYLHGIPFSVRLTDDINNVPDIKGNLIGQYKFADNNSALVLNDDNRKKIIEQLQNMNLSGQLSIDGRKLLYQGGLEIINNQYKRGATKLCLEGYPNEQKVLVKKLNGMGKSNLTINRIIPPYKTDEIIIEESYQGPIQNEQKETIYKGDLIDYPGRATGPSRVIDPDTEMIRMKNSLESGLCVDAPKPQCPAINNASVESGKAIWPASDTNTIVTGQCSNSNVINKPVRECNYNNNDWSTGIWGEINNSCNADPPPWWPSHTNYDDQICNNTDCRNGLSVSEWKKIWYDAEVDIHFYLIDRNKCITNNGNTNCTSSCYNINESRTICKNGNRFCNYYYKDDGTIDYTWIESANFSGPKVGTICYETTNTSPTENSEENNEVITEPDENSG